MDITVLNKSKVKVGIIDTIDSIIWTDRYCGVGDFELYTDCTADLLNLLQEDYYIQIPDSPCTMIIESFEIKTDVEKGNKLIVRGRDLSSILDRRLIFAQTVIDTSVQSGILRIIDENLVNCVGQPQRNIPAFIYTTSVDPLVTTPTMKAEYYTEEVLATVQYLCKTNNLGFKVVFNSSNQFVFSIYAGVDRSYTQSTNPFVVFSPNFDNLVSSDYLHTKRFKKTIALISGDAYNLSFRPTFDFDPWENYPSDPHYPTIRTGLDRYELFVDAPDLSAIDPATGVPFTGAPYSGIYVDLMYARANQALNENVTFDAFNGEADTTLGFKYQTNFFLGDIVQVENEYGLKGRSRVTEVIISENLSGRKIFPTFEKL